MGVENLTGPWWRFIEDDETEQGEEDEDELWPELKKLHLDMKIRIDFLYFELQWREKQLFCPTL